MKPFRLGRWGLQSLPLGTRQACSPSRQCVHHSVRRWQTIVATPPTFDEVSAKRKRGRPRKVVLEPRPSSVAIPVVVAEELQEDAPRSQEAEVAGRRLPESPDQNALEQLPSPPISAASSSAKLSALHARLRLPERLPLETLARALVDPTADVNSRFNNTSLAILGNDLVSYHMAEFLLCAYPRLPMAVLFAAQSAYVGSRALSSIAEEWGVEVAAEPGGEVDPGLLQFRKVTPGTPLPEKVSGTRPDKYSHWRRGMSSRVVYDDEFGNLKPSASSSSSVETVSPLTGEIVPAATLEVAASAFVRSIVGAMYLHAGAASTYNFFKDHILARHLDIASLFTFTQPARDLARLCAREGFDPPIARIISETGRLSRHPVFVVGVFSGNDKLGEAAGASLDEARFKAAIRALKGWYLYSPVATGSQGTAVPSMMEGERGRGRQWQPAVIDDGEIVA